MDQKLKERLIGVIVLVSLAVIFIPLFLTEPVNLIQEDKKNSSSSEDSEFVSKLKPVDEANQDLDIKNVEYGTVTEQIPETVTEQIPETVTEQIPETVTEQIPETVTEQIPETVTEQIPETVTEQIPETVTEQIPETVTEQIPETVTEQIPETVTLRENEVGQMNWIVQIGSFSNKENAEKLNLKAKSAGFRSFINPIMQNNRIMHQVCLGPEYDEVDANKLLEKIKNKMELDGIIKKYP